MTVYHIHHIIPRHMGGDDSPKNLIKLTIEEHANEHKKLYEEFGCWQDLIAYLGLIGLLKKGEAAQIAMIEGRKKGGRIVGKLPKNKEMQSKKIREMWKIPGMREHLIEKRREQSRLGKNPMQGKQQRKVCCVNCRSIISVNGIKAHQRKCYL